MSQENNLISCIGLTDFKDCLLGMGKVIKIQALKDATNPTLSVGNLPSGVHHLRVKTTDGKVSNVGMVKE